MQAALIRDGVHGLVLMGTVGEGNSLSAAEKRKVLEGAVEASEGKVPVIAGVSELTTAAAVSFARDAERIGAAGLMVLPAMVYVPTPAELEHHFRAVAGACALPIMLYNNPPSYRVNIDLGTLERLANVASIVALKESSPDSRRFTDIINAFGERYVLFAGLDDVVFEALALGARGWVSGLSNAFPVESLELFAAVMSGNLPRARELYRWFMPLLHLDSDPDLVQAIKLAEELMGRGSERVRPAAPAARGRAPRRGDRPGAARPRYSPASRTREPMSPAVRVIDSHTGGEPTRVVLDGGPALGAGPLAERRDRFRDAFRRVSIGHRERAARVGSFGRGVARESAPRRLRSRRDLLQQRGILGDVRTRHHRTRRLAPLRRAARARLGSHRYARGCRCRPACTRTAR